MVLVDYIGIFFTRGNTFDHILFVYMYEKKLKATDILAVQMLKFIGSFYWLYKALNTNFEYKSTVHVCTC